MSTNIGAQAPDFTLKDGEGRDWRLSEQRGRVVVVIDAEGRVRHNRAEFLSLFRPKDDEVLAAIREAKG